MTNSFYNTPAQIVLENAIKNDDSVGISKAIENGAGVNARGKFNVTPLMLAVDELKQRAVTELLARGADPNLKADDGEGAVSLAVANYQKALAIMLEIFRAGGDPNTRRPDNDPVIMRFINDRDCDGIKRMKEFGANLDITTRGDDPIITTASTRQDWDIVWCLIELGAKFDYEQTSRRPITGSLKGTFPAPDSPIFPYKIKVRNYLKAHGIAVPPLEK